MYTSVPTSPSTRTSWLFWQTNNKNDYVDHPLRSPSIKHNPTKISSLQQVSEAPQYTTVVWAQQPQQQQHYHHHLIIFTDVVIGIAFFVNIHCSIFDTNNFPMETQPKKYERKKLQIWNIRTIFMWKNLKCGRIACNYHILLNIIYYSCYVLDWIPAIVLPYNKIE